MILVKLIFSFFIIILAGRAILGIKPLNATTEPISIRIPLYFFAGTVLISQLMLIYSLIGIRFGVIAISAPFLVYSLFLIPRLKPPAIDLKSIRITPLVSAIFAVLVLISAAILINCLSVPIFSKDAFAIWCFKAKIFFLEKNIPFDILTKPYFSFSHPEYPLLDPLNLAWISLCLGEWNDILTRVFFAFSFILFIPYFYAAIRRYTDRNVSALACLLLFSNPHVLEYAANGYVDVLLGMFAAISVIQFLKWFENGELNDLLISSFFIGAAAFTKNDGIALFIALSLTVLLAKPIRSFVFFLVPAIIIFLPYQLLIVSHSISSHMIKNANLFATLAANIGRFPVILNHYLFQLYLNTYSWQYLWIFITLLLITGRKRLQIKGMQFVLLFLFLSLGSYFAVYMVTAIDNLASSFHRLLLGLAPTAVFLAFSLNTLEESKNR